MKAQEIYNRDIARPRRVRDRNIAEAKAQIVAAHRAYKRAALDLAARAEREADE